MILFVFFFVLYNYGVKGTGHYWLYDCFSNGELLKGPVEHLEVYSTYSNSTLA